MVTNDEDNDGYVDGDSKNSRKFSVAFSTELTVRLDTVYIAFIDRFSHGRR